MQHHSSSFGQPPGERESFVRGLLHVATALFLATTVLAASPRVVITPATGFTITWDGNDGGFSSPDAGAGPSNNVALASNGTTPFTSSDLGPALSIPYHRAVNLNDGLYGNAHSWISANGLGGTSDPNPFAGLSFTSSVAVSRIAWGRDNGDAVERAAPFADRTLGIYTLQFTTVATPDATTAETGDAATGWATIGTVQYLAGADDASFTSYLRHRFDVAQSGQPIAATGLRIKVSDGWTAMDEIEVNPIPDPVPPISNFIAITPQAGFTINWDRNEGIFGTTNSPALAPANDASTSRGATPFTSTDLGPALGIAYHRAVNLNDGLYGNSHSWIPNFIGGDAVPFAGLNFGKRILLRSLAWGRDNGDVAGDCCGGTAKDRTLGTYVVQITTVANPGPATPEACGPTPEGGWVTIGTIQYKADDLKYFNSYLRHRFDVAQGGSPVAATGIRIQVPNSGSCIDEIEVNSNLAIEQNAVRITNAAGFTLTWDGNDGQFNNPAVGAAPPDNRALASQGTTPFTSSDLGLVLGIPHHRAINLNDGLYGNNQSWISANGIGGTSDPDPFAGLSFGGTVVITNLAWGRDNGNVATDDCGGTCTDRALDTYRLQYTAVETPSATTPETGDAATGWQDLGTVTYASATPPFFTPYLRHRLDLSAAGGPLEATGIRIKVANGWTAIDEIEVNTAVSAPPAPSAVGITPALGYAMAWDGNDGHFQNPAAGASAPENDALATKGTAAFGSSQLDFGVHFIANVNDGFYGNSHSWIPDFAANPDPNPSIGLNFGRTLMMTNLAWSRDNGDTTEGGCAGGTCTDRALGLYTIQVTMAENPGKDTPETDDPATGWATVGTIDYRRADPPDINPHLRHRFDISAGGSPIEATGLRIKVPANTSCIDEIEVNTAATRPLPQLTIVPTSSGAVIRWTSGGGLESAPSVMGPWTCIGDAVSPYAVSAGSGTMQFYRVKR